MARIDIIVAVRNEEETIPIFLDELAALSLPDRVSLAVLFVEDSSTDGTRALLREIAARNPAVAYYCLAEGFGQGPAIAFGLSRSTADAMILMDVDGGHPPAIIPALIRGFLEGAEVVQCVRLSARNRAAYRGVGASVFFGVSRLLTGVNLDEQRTYYRLVAAEVAREILHNPRYCHYLRFPLQRGKPGSVRFIEVDMAERVVGESKYGPLRLLKLAVDGTLSMTSPRRFAILAGLFLLCAVALSFALGWLVGLFLLGTGGLLVIRYVRLGRKDLFDRMVVEESGNVPS